MKRVMRILTFVSAGCLALPGISFGQGIQVLKDEWIASTSGLHKIEYDTTLQIEDLSVETNDSSSKFFTAIALEDVSATSAGELSRNVIAVDESTRNMPMILRFVDGEGSGELLINAGDVAAFRFVTTIAVSADGSRLFFNGYSKRKRQYELWACDLAPPSEPNLCPATAAPLINGSPQMTDSVYIAASDVPDSLAARYPQMALGGLLGVTDKEILFFPKNIQPTSAPTILVDVRNLPIRNNTKFLSATLARETDYLALALSTRTVMTVDLVRGSALAPLETTMDASLSAISGCADDRSQLFRIRNLSSGENAAVNVITDNACHLVYTHTMSTADGSTQSVTTRFVPTDTSLNLLALAIGEGTLVVCETPQCTLTPGYVANYNNATTRTFLSRKVDNLCDPRIPNLSSVCNFSAEPDGRLLINPQLPQDLQDALQVDIYLPAHLFSSSQNGRFGALFVQADPVTRETLHEAVVEIDILSEFGLPELGVALAGDADFPTTLADVFNNDVVAYAPDNPNEPSANGFEAFSITVGRGSVRSVPRGYSVVFYGLMEDLSGPSARGNGTDTIGVTDAALAINDTTGGDARVCVVTLNYSGGAFTTVDDRHAYFMNLAACQFSELKTLALGSRLADALTFATDQQLFVPQLANLQDKLGKALSEAIPSAGPNAGDTNFQSTLVQLDNFESLVQGTPFDEIIYRNDLVSRIQVLRFTLLNRTAPSILVP